MVQPKKVYEPLIEKALAWDVGISGATALVSLIYPFSRTVF